MLLDSDEIISRFTDNLTAEEYAKFDKEKAVDFLFNYLNTIKMANKDIKTSTLNQVARIVVDFDNLIAGALNRDSYEITVIKWLVARILDDKIIQPARNNTTKWSEVLEWTKEKRYALNIVNKNLKTEDREYMNFAYAVARVIQKEIWKKLKKWKKDFNVLEMANEAEIIKQIEKLYYTQETVNNIFEEIAKNTNRYSVKRVDIVYTGVLTNKWKRKLKELLEFLEDERSERNTKWDNISDVIILSKTINPDKDFAKKLKNIDTIQVYKTRDWNKTYLISKLLNNWTIESTKNIIITKYSWYPLKILERIKNWNEIVVDFVDQQAWVMSPYYISDIEKVISLIKSLYKEINEVLTEQDVKTIKKYIWVFYALNRKFTDWHKFYFFNAILEAGREEKDLNYDRIADIIESTYTEKVSWKKEKIDKLLSPFVLPTKDKLEKINLKEAQVKWEILETEIKEYKKDRKDKASKESKPIWVSWAKFSPDVLVGM